MSEDDALELEVEDEKTENKEENREKDFRRKKIESELSETAEKSSDKEKLKKAIGDKPEDPKEDHRITSRALENPTRRKIMKFIGENNEKTIDDVSEYFDTAKSETKMHLGFLEQASLVEKADENSKSYKLTVRGRKCLENVLND